MDNDRKEEIEKEIKELFLKNTGAKDLDEVNGWFKKSYANEWNIDRMDKAALIVKAASRINPVGIIGDYDADGITSSTILYSVLTEGLGFENVKVIIPKRESEGYGAKPCHIDQFETGTILFMVDNGISAFEAVEAAKKRGMTVIILDHHQQTEQLPPADIIIDPATLGGADFCDYCGAGLAYRFGTAVLGGYKNPLQNKLLSLAAIGTVADVMPLKGENYVIVRNGLNIINKGISISPGLKALMDVLKLSVVTEKDIGFSIAPCINASSRIMDDGAMDVFRLLSVRSINNDVNSLAFEIVMRNEKRKEAKKEGIAAIENKIKFNSHLPEYKKSPLVIYEPGILEGVLGIIAGHFADRYNLNIPVYVFSDSKEEGVIKGSGRSSGNYNMKEELDKVSDLLLAYGGHPGAAGISLKKENFEEFRERLQKSMSTLDFVADEDKIASPDIDIKEDEAHETLNIIRKFAPWGEENPEPVVRIKQFPVMEKYGHRRQLSKDGNTVRYISQSLTAIGFGWGPKTSGEPTTIEVIGNLSANYYQGKVNDQIEILDMKE